MFDYKSIQDIINNIRTKQLFFIVGTIKSGTTWLQIILDNHPEISCRGEGHFCTFLLSNLQHALNDYNKKVENKNKTIFRELKGYPLLNKEHLFFIVASAILLLLNEQTGDSLPKVVGEKTPDHIRAMPFLHELFPSAKFLHIIRDGRDVTVSGWFHNLRVTPDRTYKTFGSLDRFVETIAKGWSNEIGLARSFAAAHPDLYFELQYEELHRQPSAVIRKILKFLGVEATHALIEECCRAGSFEHLTGGRNKGDEDRNSHFRKGVTGDWRNHFDSPLRGKVPRACW